MTIWALSPKDVKVLLGGIYQIVGMADGSFLSIKKDSSPFSLNTTMDNFNSRVHSDNRSFSIELTIVQSSTSNDVLTQMWQLDELTKQATFPILMKDDLGSSLFFSDTCWINSVPDVTYSNGMEVRVWGLQCIDGFINIGSNDGNPDILTDVTSILSAASPIIESFL